MVRPGSYERQRLQRIVELGRIHASERQSVCDELRRRIRQAAVTPVNGLGQVFRADPPSAAHPNGQFAYDPELVARLAAEHTYPEWVVSAHLDMLIRSRLDEWHAPAAGRRPSDPAVSSRHRAA